VQILKANILTHGAFESLADVATPAALTELAERYESIVIEQEKVGRTVRVIRPGYSEGPSFHP